MGSQPGLWGMGTAEVVRGFVVAAELALLEGTGVDAVVLVEVVDLVVDEHRARDGFVEGDAEDAGGAVSAGIVVPDFVVFDAVAINL